MRLKGFLMFSAAGALTVLLAALFAFSLYDVVAGAPASGFAQPGAARDLEFSDLGATVGADVARTEISGPSFGAIVASVPIYPVPLGSATCWVKQGRVQPGRSPAFKVRVRDTAGDPVSHAPTAFSIAAETNVSGSAVSPSAALTEVGGIASTAVTAGSLTDTAGSVDVGAAAGGGANTVSCQATMLVR